ncbi:uncharacterized protein L969DRAFT_47190 [Mixia osmundae IAM 14324]|uniref:Uncharacterized protein n=1 Tax=Mixia osmundae (strain CBS 9802 / IAM 14324 / JCM 22182 / KY 12970) TaxID=764103 RepID=G7E8Y5_MIXOS|nr:uncharacterized protein L969DRAFT_47190 [Mixia osmundae IAM 14324]KEI40238.1 hypothetical protein L969DRAFT_47190 [Mixia osmundae IAM 14324]GAA99603.1 hypothetical protein E5Q_06304 [Mixia osmundae IAM 14324]
MGISGLLPLLREATEAVHLSQYKGQTLAIDAYVLLHRGAYSCADAIARAQHPPDKPQRGDDKGKGRAGEADELAWRETHDVATTQRYVSASRSKVRLLRFHGVEPFFVFDGAALSSKATTEKDRASRRKDALKEAQRLSAEGKEEAAREAYGRAVDVTPRMAYQVIKMLKQENVNFIVAPYEADAQLRFLEQTGVVQGIITEDSDLLVFGCQTVIFKLDNEGRGQEVKASRLNKCREYNFTSWTATEFRQMAILSGCDYLDSISGLGLKTAYRLLKKYKTASKVIQFVRLDGQFRVPRYYEREFKRAELTFLHQIVWDPETKKRRFLTPLPVKHEHLNQDELRFVGMFVDETIAQGLAIGDLDPADSKPMHDVCPAFPVSAIPAPAPESSRSGSFYATNTKKSTAVVKGKASITSYFNKKPDRPPSQPKRKALQEIDRNSPGKRAKAPTQKLASRFFGGPQAKAALAEPDEVIFIEPASIAEDAGDHTLPTSTPSPPRLPAWAFSSPAKVPASEPESLPTSPMQSSPVKQEMAPPVSTMAVSSPVKAFAPRQHLPSTPKAAQDSAIDSPLHAKRICSTPEATPSPSPRRKAHIENVAQGWRARFSTTETISRNIRARTPLSSVSHQPLSKTPAPSVTTASKLKRSVSLLPIKVVDSGPFSPTGESPVPASRIKVRSKTLETFRFKPL